MGVVANILSLAMRGASLVLRVTRHCQNGSLLPLTHVPTRCASSTPPATRSLEKPKNNSEPNSKAPSPAAQRYVGETRPYRTRSTAAEEETLKWNLKLLNLMKHKKAQEILQVCSEMKAQQVRPDVFTYISLQSAYLQLQRYTQVLQCIEEVHEQGLKTRYQLYFHGLRAALETVDINAAKDIMKRLQASNAETVFQYDTFLRICEMVADSNSGFQQYQIARGKGLLAASIIKTMIRCCIRTNDSIRLRSILEDVSARNISVHPKIFEAVLKCGISCGDEVVMNLALKQLLATEPKFLLSQPLLRVAAGVFGGRGDVASLDLIKAEYEQQGLQFGPSESCAYVEAYATTGSQTQLIHLINNMMVQGVKIHLGLWKQITDCLCQSPERIDAAYFELANLAKENKPVAVGTINLIIQACARALELDRAFATFAEIEKTFKLQPDVHSFNGLILACAMLRMTTPAFRVFEKMQKANIQPVARTFTNLIFACLRGNDLQRAIEICGIVKDQNVSLTVDAYLHVIRKAAKSGRTELIPELIETVKARGGFLDLDMMRYIKRGEIDYSAPPELRNSKGGKFSKQRDAIKKTTATSAQPKKKSPANTKATKATQATTDTATTTTDTTSVTPQSEVVAQ
eukprot:c5614_g1_i2.p1 GENE.c5614_g1_i2~~c5614_g1_i2.p1  ORF type:complete len:631 (+),score=132.42 c5614_g1_i2:1-1893(+)